MPKRRTVVPHYTKRLQRSMRKLVVPKSPTPEPAKPPAEPAKEEKLS